MKILVGNQSTNFLMSALGSCYLSSLSIVFVVMFAHDYVTKLEGVDGKQSGTGDYLESVFRMDALNYEQIAEYGYRYYPDKRSTVAFFPFFPGLCQAISSLFGFRLDFVLLIVANICFLISCVLLEWKSSHHCDNSKKPTRNPSWSLAAFCLFPATFFFRMPYSESLFCCWILLFLLGISRNWHPLILAAIVGAATATRPVGIALAVAFWWYLGIGRAYNPGSWTQLRHLLSIATLIVISCWGLIAFTIYLWLKFDAPFAFAQTQVHWSFNAPRDVNVWDKAWALLTLEPIRGVYDPDSPRYWARADTHVVPLFSIMFLNPICFLFTLFLVAVGTWKRWLSSTEVVLSMGLLLVPYVTRGFEMSMASHARFAAIVIPQYFVLGRIFAAMPVAISASICGLMGLMMGLWTALFVAGYRFF